MGLPGVGSTGKASSLKGATMTALPQYPTNKPIHFKSYWLTRI